MVLSALLLVVSDVLAAQVYKLIVPDVDELETRYRVRHPVYHHALVPLADGWGVWGNRRYRIRTNSLGFKDRDTREIDPGSEAPRFVFIGDSFTEGIGVEYADTFAGIVAYALRERGVEVLNASMSSYAPSIYYAKMRHLIEEERLRCDRVFVFMDISDIEDDAVLYALREDGTVVDAEGAEEVIRGRAEVFDLKQFLKENSVLVRLADLIKDRFLERSGWDPLVADVEYEWRRLALHPGASWTFDDEQFALYGERGLANATRAMDALDALLREGGIGLTIVVYPWPAQILADDLASRQVEHWSRWARDHDRDFIDLFPAFIREDRDPRETIRALFIPWDVHWNEAGHALIARELLARIGPTG